MINKIYQLNDNLANGAPLFKDLKGIFNDDEDGAVIRLKELLGLKNTNKSWYNKISIERLTDEHKNLFKNQLNTLIKMTTGSKKVFSFNLPNLKAGEKILSIKINTDF